MTENEALGMLKAKLKCTELEDLACIEKGCDRQCENCDLNYEQGNLGQQKEAMEVAIKSLEEIQKYRAIGTIKQLLDMKQNYAEALSDWRQYRKIGTVEECRGGNGKAEGEEGLLKRRKTQPLRGGQSVELPYLQCAIKLLRISRYTILL